jgi:hypothetical protein
MLQKEWDQKSGELLAELAKVTKENQDLTKHVEAQVLPELCQRAHPVFYLLQIGSCLEIGLITSLIFADLGPSDHLMVMAGCPAMQKL